MGINMNDRSFTVGRGVLNTKESIEQAALRLFVEKGIAETSVRDISRAAGISQGAMYNHYASKGALARSLFLRNFSEAAGALEACAQAEEGLAAKLRAMVRYIYGRFDADSVVVAYLFLARQQYLRGLPEGFPHPYEPFRRVIEAAMERGEIPPGNDHVATSMVVGAIIQLIDTKLIEEGRKAVGPIAGRLSDYADEVAAACARLLGADAAPRTDAKPHSVVGANVAD